MSSLANASVIERSSAPPSARRLAAVKAWLFLVAALVFTMVVIGGATRLTGSGLSITEWQPILGAIPPLSHASWQEAFDKYKQIPQYELLNPGMTLQGFKGIYWWEWSHRLLGRLIGFVFFLPFVYFLARRAIPRRYVGSVAALFVLGGAQGALGWFMVKSGLADRVEVSQYRLAAHLALAVAIGGFAFWLGLSVTDKEKGTRAAARPFMFGALALTALIYLQIIVGAFVAGLRAGLASSTWPLMNGEAIPSGLDVYSPWYMNIFENPLTAQFTHRMIAYAVAIFAVVFATLVWRSRGAERLRTPAFAAIAAILVQIVLGIATIIYGVPLKIALAHQANAIVVFALALWTIRRATRPEVYSAARA